MDKRKKSDATLTSVQVKSEDSAIFWIQIAAVFFVMAASLINITFNWGKKEVWLALFAWAVGFIIPNPKLKTTLLLAEEAIKAGGPV